MMSSLTATSPHAFSAPSSSSKVKRTRSTPSSAPRSKRESLFSSAPCPSSGRPERWGSSLALIAIVRAEPTKTDDPDEAKSDRLALVQELSERIDDARVLKAMERVPRHLFVPDVPLNWAYSDEPAPIGFAQTISQPTVVALMTQAFELDGHERVLEIGTGSGYQAAVLSVLAAEVYTIEIVPPLAERARARLSRLGYANVHVLAGDGYFGWVEHAPFDRIMLTAAPEDVPATLFRQLGERGILVAPVGSTNAIQKLVRYRKVDGRISHEQLDLVQFVPMVRGGPTYERRSN